MLRVDDLPVVDQTIARKHRNRDSGNVLDVVQEVRQTLHGNGLLRLGDDTTVDVDLDDSEIGDSARSVLEEWVRRIKPVGSHDAPLWKASVDGRAWVAR